MRGSRGRKRTRRLQRARMRIREIGEIRKMTKRVMIRRVRAIAREVVRKGGQDVVVR